MYTLHDVGDQALLVEFENEISMEVNRKVVALKRALEERRLPGSENSSPPTVPWSSTMTLSPQIWSS